MTSLFTCSALRLFLALRLSTACSATHGGLLLALSVHFPFSLSRSLSLCFLDFFLNLLVLLVKLGLVMTVEVTVSEVRGEGLWDEVGLGTVIGCR